MARIQAADPEAHRGEVEGVHRLRTSTRRLRSELRTFRNLIEPEWRAGVEQELKWLAGMLGSVRDLDILIARLRTAAEALNPTENSSLGVLFQVLEGRHDTAGEALRKTLLSDRYRNLLTRLAAAVEHPALKANSSRPCRAALPPLAAAAWRRLKKRARALQPSDPETDFHEVRKRAKQARYTAELIAPALGRSTTKAAERFIRQAIRVQDVLGEHQDAVVARQVIECCLAEHGHDPAFRQAADRLIEIEREAARTARHTFFAVWDKLDRKKVRRWMRVKA